MDNKYKILLPIDFQEQSLIALEYALYFAKGLDAQIHLLHILEESGIIGRMFKTDENTIKINSEVQKLLDELAKKLDCFNVVTAIRYGKAYQQIEKYAEEINPLFILMGKTEKPDLRKRIMGSNTLHVINEIKHPVISIRGKNYLADLEKTKKDIILPLDLEKPIAEQVTAAIEFGKLFKSTIRIMTVLRSRSGGQKAQFLTKMNKIKHIIEKEELNCTLELIQNSDDSIPSIINTKAEKYDAHLVVIMTHSENNLSEFFIGSVAKEILENCSVPVLSVRPWDYTAEDSVFKIVYDPLNIF